MIAKAFRQAFGIPFLSKQWHKAGTGRIPDGRTWNQMPGHSIGCHLVVSVFGK
jgi:protein gp37